MTAGREQGDWPSRVAIVGAGTMGIGLSHVFAGAGMPTVLADASPQQAQQARAQSFALIERLERCDCADPGTQQRVREHLSAADSVAAAVADAQLIIEAVSERPEVKHEVYAVIEAAAPVSAVIATNTSSIPIGVLAAGLEHPGRFAGVHWFVPPLLVPCVEVIASPWTEQQTIDELMRLLTKLAKVPVLIGDGPGFVANRIQFALFREAARIVEEGIASAAAVDEIVRSSFGFRLPFFGPFTIADMAGLDVYADIFATLEKGLGAGFSAPAALTAHVAAGELGAKSGGGFSELSAEQVPQLLERRDRAYAELGRLRRELER